MNINDITQTIIGAAIEVHRRLGPGLLESAYRACLAYELRKRGLDVVEEQPIPVIYDEVKLDCGFRADLLVNRLVVVELKAKTAVHPIDKAQILSHLRLMNLSVGLLINFHEVKLVDGVHRVVNDFQESDSCCADKIENAEAQRIAEVLNHVFSALSASLRFQLTAHPSLAVSSRSRVWRKPSSPIWRRWAMTAAEWPELTLEDAGVTLLDRVDKTPPGAGDGYRSDQVGSKSPTMIGPKVQRSNHDATRTPW